MAKKLKLKDVIAHASIVLASVAEEGHSGERARHRAAKQLGAWIDDQVNTGIIDPIDTALWVFLAELVLDFAADLKDGKLDGS